MKWDVLERGKMRGGEAFRVAKAISPPHTPPLRPRCCYTQWKWEFVDMVLYAAVLEMES